MRVYVSSTFEDLKEYREAVIRILRQLGHEVVAMEDYVAASALPLEKVLDDVRSCNIYIGIFAWRYGYIPTTFQTDQLPPGAVSGQTSITECEYLQAKASNLSVLAFLLDERAPWPPHLIDAFAGEGSEEKIRQLRSTLQRERIVSYFTKPEDLEARASAAVTTEGMTQQVRLNLIRPADPQLLRSVSSPLVVADSSYSGEIWDAVVNARNSRVVTIDIETEWWSTRLYLLAVLAERLTQIRRILVVERSNFVGLLSTTAIRRLLQPNHRELVRFDSQLARRKGIRKSDLSAEGQEIVKVWENCFSSKRPESSVKDPVTEPKFIRQRLASTYVEETSIETDIDDMRQDHDVSYDHGYNEVCITTLGLSFVKACTIRT